MKKNNLYYFLSFFAFLLLPLSTQAVCPVCTVAVAGGVGLSRWLGIDDAITGLWIGGLAVSLIAWTINWMNKKNIHYKGRKISIILLYYLLIVVPLYYSGIIGYPDNALWGIDKLFLGITLGSVFFVAGERICCYLKKRNDGKVHFPFQKVALPVIPLIILSAIFYLITR